MFSNRCKLLFSLILSIFVTSVVAESNYGNVVISEVTSIYDADTFRVNIPGWPPIIGEHIPVRINAIDAPEMRGQCRAETDLARKAKKITVSLLKNAHKIELRNIKRGGRYFRISAVVYADGVDVGEKLISLGLARRYISGKRESWC